jgi:hypothetical protein
VRIGKRDRWEDRGVPDPDALKELRRLADRLDDRYAQLQIAEMHAQGCEEEEAAVDQRLTEEEFVGQRAADTAASKRREAVERARAAREILGRAKEFVAVGERLCDEKHGEICQTNVDAAYAERRRVEGEIAALHERAASLNAALMVCDEMAESWSYGGTRWLKLRSLFSESARRQLEMSALRRDIARRPPVIDEGALVIDAALGVRTLDGDGREVAAYTRLSDGAVRIG